MSKTKSEFSLYAHISAGILISLLLILELFSILNFRGVVNYNLKRLQKLNDTAVADIPHPLQTFLMDRQSPVGTWATSTPIITGSTRAESITILSFGFNNVSSQDIENYYINYFSSEGWQMDRNKHMYAGGDYSYEFHRQSTCVSVEIQPSKSQFSLGVWHDFWEEMPPLFNLFGIPRLLVGWQYIVPRCPEPRP